MRHRYFLAVLAVVVVLVPAFAAAQSTASPRTPWGAPDLQGVWDFRSITPLERPDELADKEFLTEEEATSLEQEAVERNSRLLNRPPRRRPPVAVWTAGRTGRRGSTTISGWTGGPRPSGPDAPR